MLDPLLNHPAIIDLLEQIRQKKRLSGEEFNELFSSWVSAGERESVVALLEQHGVPLVAEAAADDPVHLYMREIGRERCSPPSRR